MTLNNRPTLSLNLPREVQQALGVLIHVQTYNKASTREKRVNEARLRLEDELRWAKERQAREEAARWRREQEEEWRRRRLAEVEVEARIKREEAAEEERRLVSRWKQLDIHLYRNDEGESEFLPHQGGTNVGLRAEFDKESHEAKWETSDWCGCGFTRGTGFSSFRNHGRKPRKPWFRRRSPELPWPT